MLTCSDADMADRWVVLPHEETSSLTVRLDDVDIALLRGRNLGHLGTAMPDGTPHVTPVWVDTDGEAILFNTAKGRVKYRNLVRNPNAAISVVDRDDDYRVLVVRGRVEQMTEEGADEQLDKLAKKYLGADTYPFRNPAEQRVIVRLMPEHKMPRQAGANAAAEV
jgi:PPOX class probable F420-dependent enzyme